MKKFNTLNNAILVIATIMSIPGTFSADDKESGHYQDATPKRNQPYYPGRCTEAPGQLALFQDPNYIHEFKAKVYPVVSKATIISNDSKTYTGKDAQGNTYAVESNKSLLDKALTKLNGNPPTSDEVETKDKEKQI